MSRSWQLGPVVRGIRGHRGAAVLVVLQLGLGLAITVLAVLIGEHFTHRNLVTLGPAEDELSFVEVQRRDARDAAALVEKIRATRACAAAAVVARVPLHALERDVDRVGQVAVYDLDAGDGFAAATGLALQGRDFTPADLVAAGDVPAIVSRALGLPVGSRFVSRSRGPAIVVGVLEGRSYLFGAAGVGVAYARAVTGANVVVLARAEPGRAGELRAALRDRLAVPGQHATVFPALAHLRHQFGSVGAVVGVLGTIVGTIILVIVIGSMGLTYFLVAQRTREIGVRRAMGATRADVVRHFVGENVILTGAGAVLGTIILLVALPRLTYELQGFAVQWELVAASIAVVIVLNLVATWIPARKAATVPPVVASRVVRDATP